VVEVAGIGVDGMIKTNQLLHEGKSISSDVQLIRTFHNDDRLIPYVLEHFGQILPWSETFSILFIHLSVRINRRSIFHHSAIEKYTSIWIRVSGLAYTLFGFHEAAEIDEFQPVDSTYELHGTMFRCGQWVN
jgi:hypothetical protein